MGTRRCTARAMPMGLVRALLQVRGSHDVHRCLVDLAVSGIVAKETVEVAGLTVTNQTFGKLHFT